MSFTTAICVYPNDIEVEVVVKFNAWYLHAKISGPAEDCHPEESDLEILSTEFEVPGADCYEEGETPLTKSDIEKYLERKEVQAKIEDACWEHFWDIRNSGDY